MKKHRLAVVVMQVEYARRLADYVRVSSYGERWQVTAFTNAEACQQYVKQGHAIDLIAAEPEMLEALEDSMNPIPTVALVSQLNQSGNADELLQYQPLPLLLQSLSERYERSLGKRSMDRSEHSPHDRVKVLAVYSASGGTGKTALSLHLAHAASLEGYRTFYLNLERWNTAEVWLDGQIIRTRKTALKAAGDGRSVDDRAAEGLSELLYGIKSQTVNTDEWLLKHRRHHSLLKCDYLSSCSNIDDRLTLEPKDAVEVVDIIVRSGQYDVIIVDLDDGWEEMHISVLERSNHILWLTADDLSIHRKQTIALDHGRHKWGDRFERIIRRTEFVRNRIFPERNEPIRLGGMAPRFAPISLPEVGEWQRSEVPALLSSPTFRAAVGKLLKHVLDVRRI